MKKIIMFLAVTILSSAGWWLGAYAGTAYAWLLSSIGTFVGVYAGWRIGRALFD